MNLLILSEDELIDFYLKELFECPEVIIKYLLDKVDDIFLKDYHSRMKRQHDRKSI